jgi:pyruvate dehydrogenase E2 component (dihydrolipoyllysine-residue acetyltransferase)
MEFKLPGVAEGIDVVKIARVNVQAGDTVKQGDILLELLADKVTAEVTSPVDARVEEIRVKEGEDVQVGAVVMVLAEAAGETAAAPAVEFSAPTTETRLRDQLPMEPEVSEPAGGGPPPRPSAPPAAGVGGRGSGVGGEGSGKGDGGRGTGVGVGEPGAATGGRVEFRLPNLAEGIEAADIAAVLVQPGDAVEEGQPLFEVESDKASTQAPSPVSGRVVEIRVQRGEKVKVGTLLAVLETAAPAAAPAAAAPAPAPAQAGPAAGAAAPSPAPAARPAPAGPAPIARAPAPARGTGNGGPRPPVPAGPATRRLARELGVDLHEVRGSARGGRVTQEDVKAFVRSNGGRATPAAPAGHAAAEAAAPPLPDFSTWGEIERQPVSGIRRAIAEHMALAARMVPQVTQYDLADTTELEAGRKRVMEGLPKGSPKITVTVLAIKAVVAALKAFPHFNASFDPVSHELILKKYYHIGIAVDTEQGLVVPVIRNADQKGVLELAQEVTDLAERARSRKLGIEDMRGGTFTITNLGGIGGVGFSPIVNYPEVAILGMARSSLQQVVWEGKPEIRLMLPLCLSYDHRVIDGADGARFTARIAQVLSDPMRLLMEG